MGSLPACASSPVTYDGDFKVHLGSIREERQLFIRYVLTINQITYIYT